MNTSIDCVFPTFHAIFIQTLVEIIWLSSNPFFMFCALTVRCNRLTFIPR